MYLFLHLNIEMYIENYIPLYLCVITFLFISICAYACGNGEMFAKDRSQSRAELDRVCVTLTGKVTVCNPLPKVPGITLRPDSWGVVPQ